MNGGKAAMRHATCGGVEQVDWFWPFNPSARMADVLRRAQFAQAYETFQASMCMFGTPAFGITSIENQGESLPVSVTVEVQTPFCRLLRFGLCAGKDAVARPRLLLCAPQAGHHAALMRTAVRSLLNESDVYVTDWIDARDIPREAGAFGLDDHVLALERFMARLGPADLDVLAVCQATVPALAAAARLAASPGPELRSLVLMGGPVDARCHPTAIGRAASRVSRESFADRYTGVVPHGYAGAGRIVYPGFLQLSALASGQPARQAGLFLDAMRGVFLGDPAAISASMAAAIDYSATVDLPAEFIADTIDVVFHRFLLPRGKWRVAGASVRPGVMRGTHLLTVEGAEDTITGAGQTHAAHTLCRNLPPAFHEQITVADCDHYGLFSGKPWLVRVYPLLQRRMVAWRAPAPACGRATASPARHSADGRS